MTRIVVAAGLTAYAMIGRFSLGLFIGWLGRLAGLGFADRHAELLAWRLRSCTAWRLGWPGRRGGRRSGRRCRRVGPARRGGPRPRPGRRRGPRRGMAARSPGSTGCAASPAANRRSKAPPLGDRAHEVRPAVGSTIEAGLLRAARGRCRRRGTTRARAGPPWDRRDRLDHPRRQPADVAGAAHLQAEPPARPQQAAHLGQIARVVGHRHPLHGGPAEHAVEGGVVGQQPVEVLHGTLRRSVWLAPARARASASSSRLGLEADHLARRGTRSATMRVKSPDPQPRSSRRSPGRIGVVAR